MSRGAIGAKSVRVAHKGVRKFVRVPAKRSFRFVRAANPVRGKVAKARRKPWTLADALQWSDRVAREETPAQRAESRRVWTALVRAGLA